MQQKFFKERLRIAVAEARYYFDSGTTAVAPLLNLTKSGSDAIYKVAVAHLWCNVTYTETVNHIT